MVDFIVVLADGTFKGYLKQLLCFDCEFHWKFVHNFAGIAVDDESHSLFGGYSSLIAIE